MKGIYHFSLCCLLFLASMFMLPSCGGGGGGGGNGGEEPPSGTVIWSEKTDYGFNAEIYASVVDMNYIYTAGYNETCDVDVYESCSQWRIEKRSLRDGTLIDWISTAPTSTWDTAVAMTIANETLYVVGNDMTDSWRVENRSSLDLKVNWNVYSLPIPSTYDAAMALAKDSNYIYIAGYSNDESDNQAWRIEKRDIISGATVTFFDGDGILTSATGTSSVAMAIAVDPVNEELFIAGYDDLGWRIEKRSTNTGQLMPGFIDEENEGGVVHSVAGSANAIAIGGGYLYIAGHHDKDVFNASLRIEKRSLSDGSLAGYAEVTNSGDNSLTAIVLDSSCFYVAGYSMITSGNYEWHIEKRNFDLSLDSSFGTNGVVTRKFSDGDDTAWSIAIDPVNPYIYVSGYDSYPGHYQWRVEKIVK